jgi:hypothetical protein
MATFFNLQSPGMKGLDDKGFALVEMVFGTHPERHGDLRIMDYPPKSDGKQTQLKPPK